jgi:hypothetical protein
MRLTPHFANRERKPLKMVNFAPIQEPLIGLLRNTDSDLQRQIKKIEVSTDFREYRELTLLLIMLRSAANSYQALCFLLSDTEEHTKRLPRYVLVAPSVNRQIMDLWFTLVYMMDDFSVRSLMYEQAAYRQLREQIAYAQGRYGAAEDWRDWFEDMQELSDMMETQMPLTTEQKTNPSVEIPAWPHPHRLTELPSKSQTFLKLVHELLYSDTSIEAHLKPAGLMMAGGILLADIAPEHFRKAVEERTVHQYKFRHFCRTVLTLLGIISEIELHCNLGNTEQASKIWSRLTEHNADAKDIYDARYKTDFSVGV